MDLFDQNFSSILEGIIKKKLWRKEPILGCLEKLRKKEFGPKWVNVTQM